MRHLMRPAPGLMMTAAIAAVVCTLAGCGSGSAKASATDTPTVTVTASSNDTPGPSTTSTPAISSCQTSDLTLTLGPGDGAAGHEYFALKFTNTGTTTCTLNGYPGVSFVTGTAGQQLGAPAQRATNAPAVGITLQPGSAGVATIGVTQALNYEATTCQPTPVTGFRVYPPNETASAFVAYAGTGCASSAVNLLTVTAVTTGS